MQIRSTAAAGGASAKTSTTPATSANGFARVMTAQTTTATKTVSGIRKPRPSLVPKAAPTPTQQQAAVRMTMGLTEVLDRYGAGTLGSIMARIRRI